jgi:hypothetical protein
MSTAARNPALLCSRAALACSIGSGLIGRLSFNDIPEGIEESLLSSEGVEEVPSLSRLEFSGPFARLMSCPPSSNLLIFLSQSGISVLSQIVEFPTWNPIPPRDGADEQIHDCQKCTRCSDLCSGYEERPVHLYLPLPSFIAPQI